MNFGKQKALQKSYAKYPANLNNSKLTRNKQSSIGRCMGIKAQVKPMKAGKTNEENILMTQKLSVFKLNTNVNYIRSCTM